MLFVSGPETGERKRVTQKADGQLTLHLGGPGAKSWRFWLPVSAYPFLLTRFGAAEDQAVRVRRVLLCVQ